MQVDFRLPNIGGNDREQLQQIRSYLYQFIPQLQFALNSIETSGASGNSTSMQTSHNTSTNGSFDAGVSFGALKPLIIKSAEIVNAYYDEISKRLDGLYVAESDFGVYAEQTSLEIQANSTAITQSFENTQVIIQTEVEALSAELREYTDSNANAIKDALGEAVTRIDHTDEALETTRANFGESIRVVEESISQTDKLLESAKADLQGSLDDLEVLLIGLQDIVLGVTSYIKSGILYYTDAEVPVYGIEIGQEVEVDGETQFKKFTRLTAEKLSFYDSNDIEVAYISDKKLYIGQAEITTSLKEGGLIKLVLPNGDVVEKWIGG